MAQKARLPMHTFQQQKHFKLAIIEPLGTFIVYPTVQISREDSEN